MKLKIWLTASLIMVILMIFIGGLTRLRYSGLSIVEWKPMTGILPPMSEDEWAKGIYRI
jgi:cytochrome c oxidase assembly protein subunit 15